MKPGQAISLRPARLTEAQAMADMSRELIEAGLPWRYTPQRMQALIRDPETVALVACDEAGLQAFAVMPFGDDRAHLSLLCVRPSMQRRGIAAQLHAWLVASARVAGITTIDLELRTDNEAAFAFYRHLGFKETETVPGYYSRLVAARRMALSLGPGSGADLASGSGSGADPATP